MGFDWNQRAIKTEQLKLARKTKMVKRKKLKPTDGRHRKSLQPKEFDENQETAHIPNDCFSGKSTHCILREGTGDFLPDESAVGGV